MDVLIEEYEGGLWAAAMEKGRLEAIEIDAPHEKTRWGSIYWAKVKTIDAALDAAYLDLDGKHAGILYNADVRTRAKNGKIAKGGAVSIGKTFKAGQMIAAQAKSSYASAPKKGAETRESKITRLSMDIAIPGRYMIYCPLESENRVSRRIEGAPLRRRIQSMLDSIGGKDGAFIVRAAAANTQTEILMREAEILKTVWNNVKKNFSGAKPAAVMLGPDAVQRALGDLAGRRVGRIEVVTMEHLTHAEEWCSLFAPDLAAKIHAVEMDNATQDLALLQDRGALEKIRELLRPYVVLPGGGNLIIQHTAALTAIDVNRGGDKRANFAINVEAAAEIARQARLRNLGGIIVIDFIKAQNAGERKRLLAALEKALRDDPCTIQVHGATALGLVEVTRQRRTPALAERFEHINI